MLDDTIQPGVLEPVDLVNRPNSALKASVLIDAIRLFQKNDQDSTSSAVKIVREAIRDPNDDSDDSKWNRVSNFKLIITNFSNAIILIFLISNSPRHQI
jgi:hypothetical protein